MGVYPEFLLKTQVLLGQYFCSLGNISECPMGEGCSHAYLLLLFSPILKQSSYQSVQPL